MLNTSAVYNRKCKCVKTQDIYGKCSKILNTSLFQFSNKMLVFRAQGITKMLKRIANREDPDKLLLLLVKAFLAGN